MNVNLAWNHQLKGFIVPTPGAPADPFVGEIGTPKDRANGTVGFDTGRWGLSFTGTYIGKSFEDNQFMEQVGLGPHDIVIPDKFYLDSQLKFTPVRKYDFFVGVDNLLDTKAPQSKAACRSTRPVPTRPPVSTTSLDAAITRVFACASDWGHRTEIFRAGVQIPARFLFHPEREPVARIRSDFRLAQADHRCETSQ